MNETNIGAQVISLIEDKIKDVPGVKNKRHAVGKYVAEIMNTLVADLCDEYGINCPTLDDNFEFDVGSNELCN